jgi:Ras-related GTP-binding protein A/B
MDSYLSTQRSTIFQHVAVLIYVFDIETREALKDLDYYRDCIDGLKKYSAEAKVFLLVHKMDLVRENAQGVLAKKRAQLEQESAGLQVTVFGTSIYNESLYRVRYLISRQTSDTEFLYRRGPVSSTA